MNPRTVAQERASIHQECDRFYEGYDELSELLDDLLRAHARELAEEGRKIMGPRVAPLEPERVARYVLGWHAAMDHIDPKETT